MGRNLSPTALLEARGAFIRHPARTRKNEPRTDRPLGPPPKYLDAAHKKIWKEVAKRCIPGVVTESDRDAFELMVRLTYRMRNEPAIRATVEDRARVVTSAERGTLISLWSRFAMTPADRSKVVVGKPKESKLAAFLNLRKEAPGTDALNAVDVN